MHYRTKKELNMQNKMSVKSYNEETNFYTSLNYVLNDF